jgi:hypothetical protein
MSADAREVPQGQRPDVICIGAGRRDHARPCVRRPSGSRRDPRERRPRDRRRDPVPLRRRRGRPPVLPRLDASAPVLAARPTTGRGLPTFDAVDYETLDGIPFSGWPVGLSEMEPYVRPRQDLVQLTSDEWDTDYRVERDQVEPAARRRSRGDEGGSDRARGSPTVRRSLTEES